MPFKQNPTDRLLSRIASKINRGFVKGLRAQQKQTGSKQNARTAREPGHSKGLNQPVRKGTHVREPAPYKGNRV